MNGSPSFFSTLGPPPPQKRPIITFDGVEYVGDRCSQSVGARMNRPSTPHKGLIMGGEDHGGSQMRGVVGQASWRRNQAEQKANRDAENHANLPRDLAGW